MLSQLETKTSDSLGAFIRGDWMSYSSRCCYSVSIEVQQKPCAPTAPQSYAFITFRVWCDHIKFVYLNQELSAKIGATEHTPSPRVTRILVPEKHRVMRKPC